MSKRALIISVVTATILSTILSTGVLYFSSPKYAFVDSQVLMNNYQGMAHAKKVFSEQKNLWQSQVDSLGEVIKEEIQLFEVDAQSLNEQELEAGKAKINQRQQQYHNFQQSLNEKAQQRDLELTQKVVEQVNTYINRFGRDHGYDMILVANQSGNIAYAMDYLDITHEVLEGLNSDFILE